MPTNLVVDPRQTFEMLRNLANTENTLVLLVMGFIFTAMQANQHSCTVNIAGQAGNDVAHVRSLLSQNGYQIQDLANSVMQITW